MRVVRSRASQQVGMPGPCRAGRRNCATLDVGKGLSMSVDCPTCGRRYPGAVNKKPHPPEKCVICGKDVPYQGRGKPRTCCPECRGTREKLRRESVRAH